MSRAGTARSVPPAIRIFARADTTYLILVVLPRAPKLYTGVPKDIFTEYHRFPSACSKYLGSGTPKPER